MSNGIPVPSLDKAPAWLVCHNPRDSSGRGKRCVPVARMFFCKALTSPVMFFFARPDFSLVGSFAKGEGLWSIGESVACPL